MTEANGYDVRLIANLVLEEAEKVGRHITNLQLNKVLFFMHVEFLKEYSIPLISAKIEAWDYGPVFREVYNQFKKFGRNKIEGRAKKVDFETGDLVDVTVSIDAHFDQFVRGAANFYSGMPAGMLVDMSHVKGGAWDIVWNHKGEFNIGMEITNELIRKYELSKHQTNRSS